MLDERSVVGKAGEGHSMTGSGQAPGELHARVDNAGQTARYSKESSHSGSTVTDSAISTHWILLALQVSVLSCHSITWLLWYLGAQEQGYEFPAPFYVYNRKMVPSRRCRERP